MKITRIDAHDRFEYYKKQGDYISQGCLDCIRNRPEEFGDHPFYIFCHKREVGTDERIALYNDDLYSEMLDPCYTRKYQTLADVPNARFIWSPRLTKPEPQTNSMLFKAYPPGDNIKIIWMIPDQSLWGQYTKGNMLENKQVSESIHDFNHNKQKLSLPEDDDLPEEMVKNIYYSIKLNAEKRRSLC